MKIVSALLLSFALLGLAPPPPGDGSSVYSPVAVTVQHIARGQWGFTLYEGLPVTAGSLDLLCPKTGGWCLVRVNGGVWSPPLPMQNTGVAALAVVGWAEAHACITFPVVGPYGSVVGWTEPQEYTFLVGGPGTDSVEALKIANEKLAGVGGFHLPCDG